MTKKITVLLADDEFERFDAYCEDQGFKKSTLLARLVRDLLQAEAPDVRVTSARVRGATSNVTNRRMTSVQHG
jgi:hypothetical protein